MMIQNIFGKQASFERRLLFTVLGAVLAMVDVFTEPFGLALDVAWITVLFCGLPIVFQSLASMYEQLEIGSNFLTSVALIALVAIGDYHDAAYIALIFQISILVEQYLSQNRILTVNDNWLPTLNDQWHEIQVHLEPWAPIMVVCSIFVAIGTYAVTQNLVHTITLLLVLCPSVLAIIVALYQLTHLVVNAPHLLSLSNGSKQILLFTTIGAICIYAWTIIWAVMGSIDPVGAVLLFGMGHMLTLGNVAMMQHSLAQ